ncbi:MAG: SPFH domain-containing protein [Planctomycetota bacterium]|jgi:regulator of protease activity HflC (stomatin/prohibitin superfamily)
MIQENPFQAKSGLMVLILGIPGLFAVGLSSLITAANSRDDFTVGACGILALLCLMSIILALCGLFAVAPNEARALTLFGRYQGTVHKTGLWFANPFTLKQKISVRVRTFDSDKLKVNDLEGNPIEIGAVVVWKVVDTAEALFEVDDYEDFVKVQSEAALRNMATQYPYDSHEEGDIALRSHTTEIAEKLKVEVQDRLDKAGVSVLEARISHLAYAQEIASAMLQRQQASAIIAARTRIVDGAVGMVEMALEKLSEKDIVHLDEERKAQMVSNLLVVLCGDKATQPVVNTGSIY